MPGQVLLALDLSDASASAIRAAESLVLARRTLTRIVVHAHEPPYQGMLHYADVGMDTAVRYANTWKREARRAVRDLLKCRCGLLALRHSDRAAAGGGRHPARHRELPARSGRHGHQRRRGACAGPGGQRRQSGSTRDYVRRAHRAEGSFGRLAARNVLGERRPRDRQPSRPACSTSPGPRTSAR